MLCSTTPSVSEENGDISATAHPCRAMLSVAATSQRQRQVTRRIHRLHAMDASVAKMRTLRAIAVAVSSEGLERRRVGARPPLRDLRRLLQRLHAAGARHGVTW